MVEKLKIVGSNALHGEVSISGAKNAVLKLMAAAILAKGETVIHNVPELTDVNIMLRVIEGLGVKTVHNKAAKTVSIDATDITNITAKYELVSKMRASFIILGALVTRCKEAIVALPGGCAIGERRVDFHIKGLEALGAEIAIENGYVHVYRQRSENDRYTALRLVLPKLLKGGEISNREQDKLLRQIGWNGKPEYLLVCLTAKGYGNSAPTLAYTCSRLEAALHECCAVQEGNHIFCIQNLSSPGAREHMEQALPEFLRENLFQAGISCIFHSLANLNLYVREAQFALLEGAEKAPDRWIHDFADYRLDYMLERTRSEVPAADLCHPAFQALKDYDRKHPGTELFQTLYQYTVKMFHAADTANALLVHRTTFFYRLRKIQELTPIDFENPDERLLLARSVKLIPYVFPADKPAPSLPGDRP